MDAAAKRRLKRPKLEAPHDWRYDSAALFGSLLLLPFLAISPGARAQNAPNIDARPKILGGPEGP